MITYNIQKNTGFALLLTLVVVSVVLAIGLSLLEITLKQLVLSGTARDSEIAFQAAYAGTECGEHWVRENPDYFKNPIPNPVLSECISTNLTGLSLNPAADVYRSHFSETWGSGTDMRCTAFDIYVLDAETPASPVTYDFSPEHGYSAKTCPSGRVCTFIFARGYNRDCSDLDSLRTVQREIVTQF